MQKRAVILHGLENNSLSQWFPWLSEQLEGRGYEVWIPDLPVATEPHARRWTEYLLARPDWDFNDNLVIGHSAGAVEVLQLAQALPAGVRLKNAVLCAAFNQELPKDPHWAQLKGMFEPSLDFALIRKKCKEFLFVHSDNDPWCPQEQAQYLAEKTAGDFVVVSGGQHFSTSIDPAFKKFPELLEILVNRHII